MNIQEPKLRSSLSGPGGLSRADKQKEQTAMEFERIFARQLVQEMTKGLFDQADKESMGISGSTMYRQHIVDTLSVELAKQRRLGMADMVSRYLDKRIEPDTESFLNSLNNQNK